MSKGFLLGGFPCIIWAKMFEVVEGALFGAVVPSDRAIRSKMLPELTGAQGQTPDKPLRLRGDSGTLLKNPARFIGVVAGGAKLGTRLTFNPSL